MSHTPPRGEGVCGHPCSEYIVHVFLNRPGIGLGITAAQVKSHRSLHEIVCLLGKIAKALRVVETSDSSASKTSTDNILLRSGQFNQLTRAMLRAP